MHFLLVGNYGAGNLGDEALKEYFLARFPYVRWTVLSANPSGRGEVPRLPFGVRSLLCTPWWRTLRVLRSADAVVFGGGSLFTDSESASACALWWWHCRVARMFGKPLILAFQGIGPFQDTIVGVFSRRFARNAVRHSAFLSVRDEESERRVKEWNANVVLSFDPILGMIRPSDENTMGTILAVIPRMNSTSAFRNAVSAAVARNTPETVRIMSLQPDSMKEQLICDELRTMIGSCSSVHDVRTLSELTELLRGCGHVITERYHGALAAIALGLPVEIIPQCEGDKLDGLRILQENPSAIEAMRVRVRVGEDELRKFFNMVK